MKAEYVMVFVSRGPLESRTKRVFAHDVPCMRMRLGDSNVQMVSRGAVGVTEVSANAEYDRIEGFYGAMPGGEVVIEAIYGRRGSGRLRKAIMDGAGAVQDVVTESEEDDEEDDEESSSVDALSEEGVIESSTATTMDVDGIRAALDAMGILYLKRAKQKELTELMDLGEKALTNGIDIPFGANRADLEDLLVEAGLSLLKE